MATEFTPTAEQEFAVDVSRSGASLKLIAGAGAGKTSTLRLITQAQPSGHRSLYLAFNRSIVDDAKKSRAFPPHTDVATIHSIAGRSAAGKPLMWKLSATERMGYREVATKLGMNPDVPWVYDYVADGEAATVELYPTTIARMANRMADNWGVTPDPEVSASSCPAIPGLDAPGESTNYWHFANRIVPFAEAIVADRLNPNSAKFRMGHSAYLKAWFLSGEELPYDTFLIDEAQDLNPMMQLVAQRLPGQVIYVGDPMQQIYGWAGAVNVLDKVKTDHSALLTESFRFGPEIAEEANRILRSLGYSVEIKGAGKPGTVGPLDDDQIPDAILGRTNVGVISMAFDLMAEGHRVAIEGGVKELVDFAKGAQKLMAGRRAENNAELACFANWEEVLRYVDKGEDDGELAVSVRLVEQFGAGELIDRLSTTLDPKKVKAEDVDVVCSTMHKAKGREWRKVRLLSDFNSTHPTDEDMRLYYVAVTRAMAHLDDDGMVDNLIGLYEADKTPTEGTE